MGGGEVGFGRQEMTQSMSSRRHRWGRRWAVLQSAAEVGFQEKVGIDLDRKAETP